MATVHHLDYYLMQGNVSIVYSQEPHDKDSGCNTPEEEHVVEDSDRYTSQDTPLGKIIWLIQVSAVTIVIVSQTR